MEGIGSRSVVTDRAARLIAAGLTPLPGLSPEVRLQFHVAATLLNERTEGAPELMQALSDRLASMSPRTRRPIRFLEAQEGHPTGPASEQASTDYQELPQSDPR